jgi:hypothetical protein
MDLILLLQKGGKKLAKKKEDVWEVKKPYMHMRGYVTVEEFITTFERGLRGHFAKSGLFGQGGEFHIEDLAYSAEFYAENFAMIMSAIDWKEYKDGK